MQSQEDYRFDYKLFTACKDDVKNLCTDVDSGEEMDCLVSMRCRHKMADAPRGVSKCWWLRAETAAWAAAQQCPWHMH